MRIALASDVHRHTHYCQALIQALPPVDALCFLGDMDADADLLQSLLRDKQPGAAFVAVVGNNDFCSRRARTIEMHFGNVKALLTHGHLFPSQGALLRRAAGQGCALVCCGHTHIPRLETKEGITLLNPGALRDGRWALAELDQGIQARLLTL
ncbi:MAG: metallophosphatase family protein [Oscillospiraceae bacterium]|jgi:putative phosphoesterase|nr:metallophosphatase family protein [Oscillospiraceae bacterium]